MNSKIVKVALSVSLSKECLIDIPANYTGSLEDIVREQVNVPHGLGWTEDEFSVINLDNANK